MRETMEDIRHIPVLVKEVIDILEVKADKIYLDCTVGGGGHAWQILDKSSPTGQLIGIDWDKEALRIAQERLSPFSDRVILREENFINLKRVLAELQIGGTDAILFDLGVSRYQLADGERGFSFAKDGPLDMRMDPRRPLTAADLLNDLSTRELERLLWNYGEERWAKRIAQAITKTRQERPLQRTSELVDLILETVPKSVKRRIHPATKTFQALRIAVNDELNHLEQALSSALEVLNPGGRICIISYHSLEDRIVKQTFYRWARGCICPTDWPECGCGQDPLVRLLTKKPIRATMEEINLNPSARSAKLRAVQKL